MSSYVDVYSGVPEGSCLGPLLYDIYVNDLCQVVKYSKIILYADDAKLYISNKYSNATDLLNLDLDNVANWSRLWQLKLNIKKCCVMHIGHCNPNNAYYINGSQLQSEDSFKDLGITIDKCLNFNKYVELSVVNAYRRSCCILRSFYNKTSDFMVSMFKTYVYTSIIRIQYCYMVSIYN